MGRWVILIIIIGGILMGGTFLWLRSHQADFQTIALQGLLTDFQAQRVNAEHRLPDDLQMRATESWSFRFQGDELWLTAPALEKKSGQLEAADFERAREPLIQYLESWLSKRPGDSKRFPIHLHFQNEPESGP